MRQNKDKFNGQNLNYSVLAQAQYVSNLMQKRVGFYLSSLLPVVLF